MSDNSAIEWTDATWNPVTGCTKVSPGCDHCYAETFAERWRGTPGHHFENGFDVTLRPERLDQPMRWKRPRRIFVNSMSDLFHNDIPDEFIARVFGVMAQAHWHTFQVLTKRHGRMRSLLNSAAFHERIQVAVDRMYDDPDEQYIGDGWPFRNVWTGVSVEDQKWADIRIPALLDTPASVRWISAEPLLGPIDLTDWLWKTGGEYGEASRTLSLDWTVVGGESGPGARPMHPQWARDLRDQCVAAGVSYLYKQSGQYAPVVDQPRPGDLWQALDGATSDWQPGDGHVRHGGGDFRRPGSKTTLMRRARSKHDAGRLLDAVEWNEYPTTRTEVSA
jgi:protein gp37